jgi:hypothetical protein
MSHRIGGHSFVGSGRAVRAVPALALPRRVRRASPTRLPRSRARMTPSVANQPCPHIHVRSFGRFDEITDLVENASALTLACVAKSCGKYDRERTCCDTCFYSVEISGLSTPSLSHPGATAPSRPAASALDAPHKHVGQYFAPNIHNLPFFRMPLNSPIHPTGEIAVFVCFDEIGGGIPITVDRKSFAVEFLSQSGLARPHLKARLDPLIKCRSERFGVPGQILRNGWWHVAARNKGYHADQRNNSDLLHLGIPTGQPNSGRNLRRCVVLADFR